MAGQGRLHRSGTAGMAKAIFRKFWFRGGKVRSALAGPYRGLRFDISPQIFNSRLYIFFRAYEPEVSDALRRLLAGNMIVFDVGAHVGVHAIYAARLLRKGGTVFAFEPWPENFAGLTKNIALNRKRTCPIEARQMAVGDHEGVSQMVEGPTDGTHHLEANATKSTHAVELTTIDAEAERNGKAPDLILVDVEGAEMNVLEGALRVIERRHPALILEHHGSANRRKLADWLVNRGYRVEDLGPRHILAESNRH